jgi:hypothetical protein
MRTLLTLRHRWKTGSWVSLHAHRTRSRGRSFLKKTRASVRGVRQREREMSCSAATGKGRNLNHKAMDCNVISSHSPCVSLSPSSHHVSVFIPGMLLYFVLLPRASPVSRSISYTMHLHHPRTVAYPMHTMHALSLFLSRRRACFFLLRQSLSLSIRLTKRSHSRGKQ